MIRVYHVKSPTFFERALKLSEVVLVAEVNTNNLDDAYRLTNNIDSGWHANSEVKYLGPPDGCRSTSMGDVLELDGKFHVVAMIGFDDFTFTPEFTYEFRGRKAVIEGYIEPADRSVGIMGESFCPETIRFDDGSEAEYDTITDAEWLAIDEAFWKWQAENEPPQKDDSPEDPDELYNAAHREFLGDEEEGK